MVVVLVVVVVVCVGITAGLSSSLTLLSSSGLTAHGNTNMRDVYKVLQLNEELVVQTTLKIKSRYSRMKAG